MSDERDSADVRGRLLGTELTLGLLVALGAAVLVAWLGLAVARGIILGFDGEIRAALHAWSSPALTGVMRVITRLGSLWTLTAATLLIAAAYLRVGWRRGAALIVVTMAGAALLDASLKELVQRPRPVPYFETPLPASFSFPSGHALDSFCLYLTAAVLTASRVRQRALRIALVLGAAVLVLLIGVSRVYLGVHWPSDVVAGYAAAWVWMAAVVAADRFVARRWSRPGAAG